MAKYTKTSPNALKGKGEKGGKPYPKAIVKGKGPPLGDSENGKLHKIVPKGNPKGKRSGFGG